MNHVENRKMNKAGFSLIEVLIAITIGFIIMGGVYALGKRVMENVKRNSTKTELQFVQSQIQMFKAEKGRYPEDLPELRKSGFLKGAEKPKDGWDQPLIYRKTEDGKHPYELFSYGSEGKSGSKEGRISVWD